MDPRQFDKIKSDAKDGNGKLYRTRKFKNRMPNYYGWLKINGEVFKMSAWNDCGHINLRAIKFDESYLMSVELDELGLPVQPNCFDTQDTKEWIS